MVENGKKHRQNSHPIIHCPTSEGVSEVSERANEWAQRRVWAKRAVRSKRTSGASERANGRASGPVLQSVFLAVPDHCVLLIMKLAIKWTITARDRKMKTELCSNMTNVYLLSLNVLFSRITNVPLSFKCRTMVENRKKYRQNSHPIIHCSTSERCERTSERTSEWPSTTVCILGCYRP